MALYHLDVKNAFLHDDIQEEVYMSWLPEFVPKGQENKVSRFFFYKKKEALSKQSSFAQFERLSPVMYKYGYKRCQAYHTFFVKRHNYKATILNVYIDGVVVKSNDTQNIKNLKA